MGLAYVEGMPDGGRLRPPLRGVAARMPLVLLKGGATAGGQSAAASHTGSLATDDRVFDGVCRQAGAIRAATVEDAFEAAATFATQPLPAGPRAAVITTAGGWGVVTADAITRSDLELAALPDDLRAAIDEHLPPRWSRANPIDLAGGETRDTIPTVLELIAAPPRHRRRGLPGHRHPVEPGPPDASGAASTPTTAWTASSTTTTARTPASPRPPPTPPTPPASRCSAPPSWPWPTPTTPARRRSGPPAGSATPRPTVPSGPSSTCGGGGASSTATAPADRPVPADDPPDGDPPEDRQPDDPADEGAPSEDLPEELLALEADLMAPDDEGVLPMFPLGSVLVPTMVLPLHIFEHRYRRLVRDCLAATPEFGVVLIERGGEVGGGEVRTDVGTVARMVEAAELPDGRFAVQSVGTRRIRVLRWLDDAPYPRAVVEDWPDEPGPDDPDPWARRDEVVARLHQSIELQVAVGDRPPPDPGDSVEISLRPGGGQLPGRCPGTGRPPRPPAAARHPRHRRPPRPGRRHARRRHRAAGGPARHGLTVPDRAGGGRSVLAPGGRAR